MTKVQFNVIRALAFAYGHEWAVGLDFAEVWPRNAKPGEETTTRGDWARMRANPTTAFRDDHGPITTDDIAYCKAWAKWIELHDQIERGYIPTTKEISDLATPLFDSDVYLSTPQVSLDHETCSHQTRWSVKADGEVQFERWSPFPMWDNNRPRALMARARVWTATSGQRVAMVDAHLPLSEWPQYEIERLTNMLVSAGASQHEAQRAIRATEFGGKHVCHFDLAFCAGVPIPAIGSNVRANGEGDTVFTVTRIEGATAWLETDTYSIGWKNISGLTKA
jgi:hypothetical protein